MIFKPWTCCSVGAFLVTTEMYEVLHSFKHISVFLGLLRARVLTPMLPERFCLVLFLPDDSLEQVAKSSLIGACLLKPGASCDWKRGRRAWELNVLSN